MELSRKFENYFRRFSRVGLAAALVLLCGCVSISIPQYLKDKHPYKKKFFAGFAETHEATRAALREAGWIITEEADPRTFERDESYDEQNGQQVLIFTEEKQLARILYSRYYKLNVLVRSLAEGTEVEIRYLSITPVLFYKKEQYKNDGLVNAVMNLISKKLEQK